MQQNVVDNLESQRALARESLFMGAKITVGTSPVAVSTVIRNLSAGGAMIDCPAGLKKGDEVVTHLRNIGEVPGKVAWIHAGRAGVMFAYCVDPDEARTAIKRTALAKPTIKGASLSPLSKGAVVEVHAPGMGVLRGTIEFVENKRMSLIFEKSLLNDY